MDFKPALKKALESKKRNFEQTVELIINLKGIDTKVFSLNDAIKLPAGRGKGVKICAVGSGDFVVKAKKCADRTFDVKELLEVKEKKEKRKLANEYEHFVVEANVMTDFAKALGQFLGPRGKMPLPHHIVPPGGDPCPKVALLRDTVRIKAKKSPVVQVPIGTEKMSVEELEKNAHAVMEFLIHKLERGNENVKEVLVKLTMGPAVKVE